MAYTKPQQRNKGENERIRGEQCKLKILNDITLDVE